MINRLFCSIPVLISLLTIISCGNRNNMADAYGNFESEEIIISAQSTGELIKFDVEEGEKMDKGALAGITDTIPVTLQIKQLHAQINTLAAKRANVHAQAEIQKQQLKNLERETVRLEKLYRQQAATEQQYEDMLGKLDIARAQLQSVETQYKSINAENKVLESQSELLENQLQKCRIINPVKGTILEKYANTGELVTTGKSLYKIANLDVMELKVYVSGNQLAGIHIGDTVSVLIDKAKDEYLSYPGVVSWISSGVEFTPKIIQTREERVNMVYGVKIRVKNDGSVKIGMPGEVKFSNFQSL